MHDNKWYINADSLFEYSVDLSKMIIDDQFQPNFIVGIWRGGTPVGITVQEMLEHCGIESDHIAIRTCSYKGMERQPGNVIIDGLDYIVDRINADDRLLIVDDVFDTGLSIQAILDELKLKCRSNHPKQVRIATPFFKPSNNRTEIKPDYYIHETDRWLVFPHELKGLSDEEIMIHKPYIHHTLARLKKHDIK